MFRRHNRIMGSLLFLLAIRVFYPVSAGHSSCPVTPPNVTESPDDYWIVTDGSIGNAEGTLFTIPWPDGTVVFRPGGPGFVGPDGSLSMKWPWYRHNIEGQLTIVGRRLDAPASVLHADVPEGYGDTGFQATGLIFASEGCWEVTGRVGDHSLTFVTMVIRVEPEAWSIPFRLDVPRPSFLSVWE